MGRGKLPLLSLEDEYFSEPYKLNINNVIILISGISFRPNLSSDSMRLSDSWLRYVTKLLELSDDSGFIAIFG